MLGSLQPYSHPLPYPSPPPSHPPSLSFFPLPLSFTFFYISPPFLHFLSFSLSGFPFHSEIFLIFTTCLTLHTLNLPPNNSLLFPFNFSYLSHSLNLSFSHPPFLFESPFTSLLPILLSSRSLLHFYSPISLFSLRPLSFPFSLSPFVSTFLFFFSPPYLFTPTL